MKKHQRTLLPKVSHDLRGLKLFLLFFVSFTLGILVGAYAPKYHEKAAIASLSVHATDLSDKPLPKTYLGALHRILTAMQEIIDVEKEQAADLKAIRNKLVDGH